MECYIEYDQTNCQLQVASNDNVLRETYNRQNNHENLIISKNEEKDEILNDDMNSKFKVNIAFALKKLIDYYVNDYGFFKDDFLIAVIYLDPR